MKILLALLLLFSLPSFSQTALSWTQIPTTDIDLNRPGAGANEWTEGQNVVNIPDPCCNTTRLDKYYRFLWRDFYPGTTPQSSINWTRFDIEIQDAINNRQSFSFGIMQQCGGCDANRQENVGGAVMTYPIWLHNLMQAESPTDYIAGGQWYPNYNSPSYIAAVQTINNAINSRILSGSFMGVPYKNIIFQIDVRFYGDFGEWTENDFSGPAGTQATSASLISIIDAVKDAYPSFQVCVLMATFDGNQLGNTMIPPAVGYHALTTSNAHGRLGWRRDNWGWQDNYNHLWTDNNNTVFSGLTFKDSIMTRYKDAPVLGEPADGAGFTELANQMTFYHVNSFGNGNIPGSGGTLSTQNAFRAASKLAGYRLTLVSAGSTMTTSPQTGSNYNVTINWLNVNGTPAYQDWKIIYEWRDGPVVLQRDTAAFLLKGFRTSATDNETFTMRTVPAGTHDLYLKVVDPLGYRIPMPLFITGRLPDGSYPVRLGITVTAGSGAGVANAGPSQTITLPTNSVTLNGSASSGTITSYSWTQLPGGPSTASLATPSSVTTTASNLIAGTYLFQLQINGSSTDTMRVYVNPAIPPSPSATTIFTIQTTASGTVTDGAALEVGLKFQSTVAGYITGIRFYKTTGNTGTHIGQLYKGDGTLLASATFTNETASGWQVVQLVPAIPILANTTYVTAYFSPNGFYSYSANYLGANIVNSPLIALADGVDGRNGVYDYSATPTFPTSYSTNGNRPWYGNDIVFSLTNPGTAPKHVGKKILFIENLNLR